MTDTALQIPDELKPADGRFGSGPSRVRPEQLAHLAAGGRGGDGNLAPPGAGQAAGRADPGRTCASCSRSPTATRSSLGNGGTTAFWDAATCCLVRERALHLVYGEFSSKFAALHARTRRSSAIRSWSRPSPAMRPSRRPIRTADVIAWAHNETSTGVMVPVSRPAGAGDALVLIDATSAAGGLPVDVDRDATPTTSRRRRASPPTADCGSRC